MKFFLDTEFSECQGSLKLISIGIVSGDGRRFYAESADFKDAECNAWVQKNVLPKLVGPRIPNTEIARGIIKFIGSETPEFWGYYCDYDWVLLCWLFGTMVDLPRGWPMLCLDLQQSIHVRGFSKLDLPPQPANAHHALADAEWVRNAHAVIFGA